MDEQLVFKYQKPGNTEFNMLSSGQVFFASPSELNDGSECRPRYVLKGSEELWWRLGNHFGEIFCFKSPFCDVVDSKKFSNVISLSCITAVSIWKENKKSDYKLEKIFEELPLRFLKLLEEINLGISKKFLSYCCSHAIYSFKQDILNSTEPKYILSLSKTGINSTLWGHYSAADTGFVKIYAIKNSELRVHSSVHSLPDVRPSKTIDGVSEIGKYEDALLELFNVQYKNSPPKVNAFHNLISKFRYSEEEDHYDVPLLIGEEADKKKEEDVGIIKSLDWKYEKELRCFLPSFEIDLPPEMRIMKIDKVHHKGIILGPKMSQLNIERALAACYILKMKLSKKNEEVIKIPILKAVQSKESFSYDVKPVGLAANHWIGGLPKLEEVELLNNEDRLFLEELCKQVKSGFS